MSTSSKQMQFLDNQFPADPAHLATHGFSLGALVATFMGWLPAIIALVPAVYYSILIYESKTVQKFFQRRRAKRLARRIHAKHKARAKHGHSG
jgi:energy-converting hydrogenase Eha subunit B